MVRRRVRQLRDDKGWSGQQLVDAMHRYGVRTTRSTLGNFENGYREDITFGEAIAIALALQVPLSYLVGPGRYGVTVEDQDSSLVRLGEEVFPSHVLAHELGGGFTRANITVDLTPEQAAAVFGTGGSR